MDILFFVQPNRESQLNGSQEGMGSPKPITSLYLEGSGGSNNPAAIKKKKKGATAGIGVKTSPKQGRRHRKWPKGTYSHLHTLEI